ncbi:Heat shock 70 kDa protein 12B [Paramyrothecium foliicola]|nr:Heat shock 70 kDa protein 12B [Paramyrothecium foliicola]
MDSKPIGDGLREPHTFLMADDSEEASEGGQDVTKETLIDVPVQTQLTSGLGDEPLPEHGHNAVAAVVDQDPPPVPPKDILMPDSQDLSDSKAPDGTMEDQQSIEEELEWQKKQADDFVRVGQKKDEEISSLKRQIIIMAKEARKKDDEHGDVQRRLSDLMRNAQEKEGELNGLKRQLEDATKDDQRKDERLDMLNKQMKNLVKELNKAKVKNQSHMAQQTTDKEVEEKVRELDWHVRNFTFQFFEQNTPVDSLDKPQMQSYRDLTSRYLSMSGDFFVDFMQSQSQLRCLVIQALVWAVLNDKVFGKFAWCDQQVAKSMQNLVQFLDPSLRDEASQASERFRMFNLWRTDTSILAREVSNLTSRDLAHSYEDEAGRQITKFITDMLGRFTWSKPTDLWTEASQIVKKALDLDKLMQAQVAQYTWVHQLNQLHESCIAIEDGMMSSEDGLMDDLPPYSDEPYAETTQGQYNTSDDTIVIGIDFGTTNSGAAWATLDDIQENQVFPVYSWPGSDREEAKAPTELYYEDDEVLWGYEVPIDADPVRWFKLLLLKDEDLDQDIKMSEPLIRARKMLKENGKSEVDFIADYLGKLWRHTLQSMNEARETIIETMRFHIVMTVPAIWKGYARQGMEAAAKQSGMLDPRPAGQTTLSFVPEPEAAALATLSEPGRKFQQNDAFVVCDAGGGTVDLISYKVESTKPIQLAEAVEGTGGLCGGIFVDDEFERICKSRLGRRWDKLSKAGINEVLKREWEYGIKPQFKLLGGGKRYTVSIPAEAFAKASSDDTSREPVIRNGRIHFREEDIQEAFARVLTDIEKLVDGQIQKLKQKGLKATGIILVGGLGCSPYLYEHLKSRYQKDGISLLQSGGNKPGAVYKGFLDGVETPEPVARNMPVAVTSTVARASYGTTYRTPFDNAIHVQEDKVWDERELIWKAENQVKWFIKKGENVSKKNPVRDSYYELHKRDPGLSLQVDLQTCEDEYPPTRKTASVKQLCFIESTRDVAFKSLPDYVNDQGERFKKLSYEIEMTPSGATLDFQIYIDGRKQQSKDTNIMW